MPVAYINGVAGSLLRLSQILKCRVVMKSLNVYVCMTLIFSQLQVPVGGHHDYSVFVPHS